MTITLDVGPELEGALKEEAEASGVPLPDYLLRIVENREKPRRKPSEDEIRQALLAEGLISSIPPPRDLRDYREFVPIPIEGKPLSEQIIEERR